MSITGGEQIRPKLTLGVLFLISIAGVSACDGIAPSDTAEESGFDPRTIAGRWIRVSPFQTFSNVKGGANEFQREITMGLTPDLDRDTGLEYSEPVFTEAGQAAFDANVPSYGLRITPPRLGNDPQGECDPWGVPRMLNGQVAGPHATWEIIETDKRMLWFVPWHHELPMVWTDGRPLPEIDEVDPKWNGYSVGRWERDTARADEWDEQVYGVPSEEARFNNLIRDGNVGQ